MRERGLGTGPTLGGLYEVEALTATELSREESGWGVGGWERER